MLKWMPRMSWMSWTVSLAGCGLAAGASVAWAGVVFEESLWTANHGSPHTAKSLLYADQGKLRIEGSDGTVSIILPDQGYNIRPQDHSCLKVTRREPQAELGTTTTPSPPAVRPQIQYTPTDGTDRVDGYTCHTWTYRDGGFRRGDLCVVPASSSEPLGELLAAFHTMSRLTARGAPLHGKLLWWRSDSIDQFNGVPIRLRLFAPQVRARSGEREPTIESETTYKLVAVGDQPERLFRPPQDYECRSKDQGGRP